MTTALCAVQVVENAWSACFLECLRPCWRMSARRWRCLRRRALHHACGWFPSIAANSPVSRDSQEVLSGGRARQGDFWHSVLLNLGLLMDNADAVS
ncbi:hypothetical protein A5727_00430 [Mycobacterium sp. ACS4331]|nr:hypothetical protein A5727_00430 [Mycobacterium sp. ACS4331]